MYQIARMLETTHSRNALLVCITRLAMRPAKSFWKNGQLCRTTCQWLCQRIRLVTPGTTALLRTRLSASIASGRPISTIAAIASSVGVAARKASARSAACISVTSLPMKTGISVSISATAEAGREHRGVEAAGLADEVPVERDQAGRWCGARRLGRADAGFEEGEHGDSRRDVSRWRLAT